MASDYAARGVPVSPDRVLITTGTSEGIELALNALVDEGDEVSSLRRHIRCTPPSSRRLPRNLATTAPIPTAIGFLISIISGAWSTPRTRVLVVIDPNNPTGAVYPPAVRRALIEFAERHDLTILADEVYGDLGFTGPLPLLGSFDLDAPVISFSSVSKAYLAPGWRAGWMVVGSTPRLDDALAAVKKLADGRLCSPGPMNYAVEAALTGDRSHQAAFRAALAERGRITTEMLNAIPGMRCVAPQAAFYVLPSVSLPPGRTDEHYVLSLLREKGILCVNGSGFGVPASGGFFRIVFLAEPKELEGIYADIGEFTREYLARG